LIVKSSVRWFEAVPLTRLRSAHAAIQSPGRERFGSVECTVGASLEALQTGLRRGESSVVSNRRAVTAVVRIHQKRRSHRGSGRIHAPDDDANRRLTIGYAFTPVGPDGPAGLPTGTVPESVRNSLRSLSPTLFSTLWGRDHVAVLACTWRWAVSSAVIKDPHSYVVPDDRLSSKTGDL